MQTCAGITGHDNAHLIVFHSLTMSSCAHPRSACEQAAARTLGFTQASWDDTSGKEVLPWSMAKYWDQLTKDEQKAAEILCLNKIIWNNHHVVNNRPWTDLASCPNGKNVHPCHYVASSCFSVSVSLLPYKVAFGVRMISLRSRVCQRSWCK